MRHDWNLEDLRELYEMAFLDLVFKAASIHREHHNSKEMQLCHLVSIKTGGCPEDCKYCAQSSRYQTEVSAEKMMDLEKVLIQAKKAKERGASRICLGAAWRGVREGKAFNQVLEMITKITEMGLEVCCTLGMLSSSQAEKLKEAGLYAYNHNLDTSEKYYKTIITTRTYQDRLETLEKVREADLTVCCGGIIGLGESIEDRLSMLKSLSSLDPHPESVPINRLVPIKGTPLGERPSVGFGELVRMIALARIVMPKSMVRLAAGRLDLTAAEQTLCFLAGANSLFIGEKLLTAPNPNLSSDMELLQELGLEPREAYKEERTGELSLC